MWKSVLLFLVLVAFVSAKELEKEDGEDSEFLDQNDKENENLEGEVNQEADQSDPIQDDRSSDPLMSEVAQSIDDDTKELTEELLKDHETDDSDPDDVKNTDEHEADANADQVKTEEEQEKQNDEPIAKEVKVVQRGWGRRRRRRRRRSPPPSPIRTCGSIRYNARTHSCCFNKFVRPRGKCPVFRCGRTPSYNPYLKRCCYGRLYPRRSRARCPVYRCGHYHINPRFQSCCRRGRKYRVYNRYTHKCCYGIPIARCYPCHPWGVCGSRLYSTWIYRCCANHLIYSHHFQRCCYGKVMDKEALCLSHNWSGK